MNRPQKNNPKPPKEPLNDQLTEGEERDDAVIVTALKWSTLVLFTIGIIVVTTVWWHNRPAPVVVAPQTPVVEAKARLASEATMPVVRFTDITESSGIDFIHENGASGEKLLPETMGGGCAFFDYDQDGDQDLLLVNSNVWTIHPDRPSPSTRLYKNAGNGQFEDVTEGSGIGITTYGMGAAVGDFDNDGRVDVFLSALGKNHLFRNLGNGKFLDITDTAGVSGTESDWSTSCGWFDFDNDSDLDLFVCNYLTWTSEFDKSQDFQLTGGGRAYGRPQNFEGSFSFLYQNDGDGKFTDISEQAGIRVLNPAQGTAMGKSLGVTFRDLDSDGWMDIVVANDTVQNFLFRNTGKGRFEETAAIAGLAFDMNGNARGAMGIDTSTFRNNGSVGIAIGNFANEMTALYVSGDAGLQFADEAISTGLGPNTRLNLTFGVCYVDYDLDGRMDLFAANGHLEEDINRVQPSQTYEQPPQLFWNCGPEQSTEFMPVDLNHCGEEFLQPIVGRGSAVADIDGDGDQDLLITATGARPRLLRNDQNLGHHWLQLKLTGTQCNLDAIGAQVSVRLADQTMQQQVMPTRSYLSQSELPLTFGLGTISEIESVEIKWPDGSSQTLADVEVNQRINITQE
ncbi:MAG: CRTAC1 family protein [Planctomycetaceae bacterium]|nr:CRTAC1 family protein [Planctomycetaceae bacterium]